MKLDYYYFRCICAKGSVGKKVSRCMMCGRPFNHMGYISRFMNKYYSFRMVLRKKPLHWNYIKGMYVCDHCIDDIDRHEIDLTPCTYKRLIKQYITPHEELQQIYENNKTYSM